MQITPAQDLKNMIPHPVSGHYRAKLLQKVFIISILPFKSEEACILR